MGALQVRGLRKQFGRVMALDGLDLDIPQGSTTAVVGANGAGKTTLFGILAGFVRADAGDVSVLGKSPCDRDGLRGRLALLPQDATMDRQVTVMRSLEFFGRLQGLDRERSQGEARRVLDLVGLGDVGGRSAGGLSHGMALRVSIAQAFLGQPELVLLDEPTAGLDPRAAAEVREALLGLRGTATILVASHDLAEVERLCDRVVILSRGQVVQTDTMDRLTSAHAEVWIDVGVEEPPWDAIARLDSRWKTHWDPQRRRISIHFSAAACPSEEVTSTVLRLLLDADVTICAVGRGRGLEARFLESTDD